MSENWKIQLSIKVDAQHLLNLRADTGDEMSAQLAWAEEHKEPILIACAALGGVQRPQQAQAAATPRQAPIARPRPSVAQGGADQEIGPLYIEKVEIMKGPKGGPNWKNPLYIVKWEGASAGTFDGTLGKAAVGFWQDGNPCFVTTSPSPKGDGRFNLDSIRMATQ